MLVKLTAVGFIGSGLTVGAGVGVGVVVGSGLSIGVPDTRSGDVKIDAPATTPINPKAAAMARMYLIFDFVHSPPI